MILTLCGSLRANSTNFALLQALVNFFPHEQITHFTQLAQLPAFNPDLAKEQATLPPAVAEFYQQLALAEGILLASPEYASEIPGALKRIKELDSCA